MKTKTSITLPRELLALIDRVDKNRSAFLERASRAYLALMAKAQREARDRKILDSRAERLNEEALDVLDYQGVP